MYATPTDHQSSHIPSKQAQHTVGVEQWQPFDSRAITIIASTVSCRNAHREVEQSQDAREHDAKRFDNDWREEVGELQQQT